MVPTLLHFFKKSIAAMSSLIDLNCWLIVLIINPWIYIHINESTFTLVLFCVFLQSHPMFSIQDFRTRRKAVYTSCLLLLLEILNGSSWDLSLLCHWVHLILLVPPGWAVYSSWVQVSLGPYIFIARVLFWFWTWTLCSMVKDTVTVKGRPVWGELCIWMNDQTS